MLCFFKGAHRIWKDIIFRTGRGADADVHGIHAQFNGIVNGLGVNFRRGAVAEHAAAENAHKDDLCFRRHPLNFITVPCHNARNVHAVAHGIKFFDGSGFVGVVVAEGDLRAEVLAAGDVQVADQLLHFALTFDATAIWIAELHGFVVRIHAGVDDGDDAAFSGVAFFPRLVCFHHIIGRGVRLSEGAGHDGFFRRLKLLGNFHRGDVRHFFNDGNFFPLYFQGDAGVGHVVGFNHFVRNLGRL